ncbi:DUF4097 family beta strand repeat-containing protein [Brevibacterium sp.]|uniref:DUF4097 family beta strand repeat-containing protein n=1 Tax=Brevibacterium sp. TaxID=1701 RepID=UPI002811F325|nr:DUF4097 family beta strand repeat-containing protein [Brevibacterium sp.]
MPATVQLNPSTRSSLRALIVIAAIIVLLIPVGITVAHGASRLNYGKLEVTEPLPASLTDLQISLDSGADIEVKTAGTDAPSVRFTGTGPRGQAPGLDVREAGSSAVVSVDDLDRVESPRIEVVVPATTSQELKLDLNGGFGSIDIAGDYREIASRSEGGDIEINGSADKVRTSTNWGSTDLYGTFGTLEARTEAGSIDGSDLGVRDRVDATTATGEITLDFSNEMAPLAGIVAKAGNGDISLHLPRLDAARASMAAEAASGQGAGNDAGAPPAPAKDLSRELLYRISADSTQGEVSLVKDLEKYDASKGTKSEGSGVIPVSVTTETGDINIDQN